MSTRFMPPPSPQISAPLRTQVPIEVVVIGVSTGGPNALARLLSSIPPDLSVPIVIVQHMPPEFTKQMAERLAARTPLDIREAIHGQPLHSAQVWIAPGDFHLFFARERGEIRLRTNRGAPENSCRPSVDVLFRSAAAVSGPGVLAVVMTGMGQDGLSGAESIRDAGGKIIVQDQETSVVWGMPGAIARARLADEILPLDELAPAIVRRVRRSRGLSTSGIFREPVEEAGGRLTGASRLSAGSSLLEPPSSGRLRPVDLAQIQRAAAQGPKSDEINGPTPSFLELRTRRAERLRSAKEGEGDQQPTSIRRETGDESNDRAPKE